MRVNDADPPVYPGALPGRKSFYPGQDRQSEDVRAQTVLTAKSGAIGPLRMVLSTNSKAPPRNSRCSIRNEPNTAGLVTSFTTKHEMTTPL